MLEEEKNKNVDLKQFKGHHRRFPWALLIRIFVASATIFMIWLLMEWTKEMKANRNQNNEDQDRNREIEIEYNP